MAEMNWKTGLLITVIVLGASLEVIKRLPKGEPLSPNQVRSTLQQEQAYNVRAPKRIGGHQNAPRMMAPPRVAPAPSAIKPAQIPAMTKEQMEKFAANLPKAVEAEDAKKAEAKKKDGKEDEWEIVVDPKTGKRIKRKKKKVAKIEEKKEEVAKKEEPKKEEPPPAKEDEDINAAIATAIATGKAPASNSRLPDEAYASAEEWMRKLLSRPNLAETKRFIDHYNKALVTPEVFYRVVNAMVTDSRQEMKQLGVLCLGSTPSVLSFQGLVQVIKNDRSGAAAIKDAEGFADGYKEMSRLPLLQAVLGRAAGAAPKIYATQKVEEAAQKYLAPQAATASQGNSNGATVSAQVKQVFNRFEVILTALAKSKDAAVKDQASRTLAVVQGLLSNSGGAPVTPGPVQASQ